MFRSAVLPAAASWVRAVRPALVVGLVVAGLAFAVMHGSTDPWLFGYYTLFGVCTGLMAIISRGVDDSMRQALAEQLAPFIDGASADHPVTLELKASAPRQVRAAKAAVGHALEALYNRAQIDVLRRAQMIIAAGRDAR
ncbi:hypothetical protein Hesp01_73280 [Herbidospora sp. NBRC 101105]|nr:hypothetical protein Hesp01_73280 [Herbidospora sp. NBRC 101105]